MNRRGFLSLFGAGMAGIALEQAIPLNRVWSFPKEIIVAQPAHIRFFKAWDPVRARMICRLDVLYAWPVVPSPTPAAALEHQITVRSETLVPDAIEAMVAKFGIPALPYLQNLRRTSKNDPELRGIWYDFPPPCTRDGSVGSQIISKSDSPSPS